MKSNLFKLGFEDVKAMDAEAKAVSSSRGIYDFYVKSYIGMINETISILSIIIFFIKERKKTDEQ